jgi:hypothetical protein
MKRFSASKPLLEIHVPISPTEHFFTMLHYLAASLQINGGALRDSPIVVTVGADQEPEEVDRLAPWSRGYPIRWHWVPRDVFRRHSYYATALERFRLSFQAPMVAMLDADMMVAAPFTELVEGVLAAPAFVGVIAHVSPFLDVKGAAKYQMWDRLFAEAGLGSPPLCCEHTGWGTMFVDPGLRFCPPYFNLGMLLAPRCVMKALGDVIYDEMEAVNRVVETCFRCQIAVSLALARLKLPWRCARMRFNFPNDHHIANRYAQELIDVRILHYLRVGPVDKSRDFLNVGQTDLWLKRHDLIGVDQVLQDHVRALQARVLAESRQAA